MCPHTTIGYTRADLTLREGAAQTVDKSIRDKRREYNDGLIDATVNCALACAYQDNNPNQQYMTTAIMEAMEQNTRQSEALQQIRDIPEVRDVLGQPRVMSVVSSNRTSTGLSTILATIISCTPPTWDGLTS